MDIFAFITLLGGLAFFLYGMHVMSTGLEKIAGGKLEKTIGKMTATPMKSLLFGAGITIAIQSSSAMTVMLVGLVNSGIMQLTQTVGVIMGSNIGTTLTAWILSLSGIESENVFIRMLNPEAFSPIFALIGIGMIMMAKKKRKKDVGTIFVGFSILMCGMSLMGGAVSPLAQSEQFTSILTAFRNPIIGVLVGTIFTGIIQSSAASVGILQALSITGGITYGMAIPIIMGQNIGTCVTSLISSIGVNKNAKRVAIIHILFNIIGTLVCLTVYYSLNAIIDFSFNNTPVTPISIAMVHSIFNVITTIMLFPFQKLLVKMAVFLVRDNKKGEKYTFIDERLLNTPSFAISECNNIIVKMANIARETIFYAISLSDKYDEKIAKKGSNVGLSFYAFFANKNDDPECLMEAAHWWIIEHRLDHFE
ncbi:MAG: Na/Pi symporter, partial [Clostridia bacterium]